MFFSSRIGSGPSGMAPWTLWIDINIPKKIVFSLKKIIFFSISLINLSWIALKLDLTLQNCRFYHGLSIGVTNSSVRPIGCSLVPGEGTMAPGVADLPRASGVADLADPDRAPSRTTNIFKQIQENSYILIIFLYFSL